MKTFIRNIYTRTALCALLAAVAVSCTEEKFGADDPVEYGRPVTVSLSYGAPDMQVQTRALNKDEEGQVNDLFVLFFDAQTDTLVKSEYYDNTRLKSASAGNVHEYGGNVHITISTGKYHIMGIANLAMGEIDHKPLIEQLEEVKNMTDFNALTVRLGNPGSISRVVPALVMGGGYRTGNDSGLAYDKPEVCEITGSGSLQGSIHLRRLDSRIKFVIQNANPTDITQLQLVSWQVINVPISSYLTEQAKNASNVGYDNSLVSNEFDNTIENQSSFEFYMMENKQSAKKEITDSDKSVIPGQEWNPYHERERKKDDKFIYAPDSATYVEIRMRMQLKVHQDNGTTIDRSADVKYTVHLGYCQGETKLEKANDFFSLRNTKYTYTVKVKGVDKIVVEATTDKENQPGAEGLVVDYIGGERIQLDAHYSVFNISLTPKEISTLHYRIKTPFGSYETGTFNADNKDCTWIRFAKTTGKEELVNYTYTCDKEEDAKDDTKWLMTIDDLKKKCGGEGETLQWFTVFVDEYVYADKAPRDYVNKEARELYIYADYESSLDGNSTYVIGKYVIAQRSIQTFYDLDNSNSLLGVEHADETKGYNLDWNVTPVGNNTNESKNWYDRDGWLNVAHGSKNSQNTYGIVGREWDKYAELTKPDKKRHKTFQMKNNEHTRNVCGDEESDERIYYEILWACLSRNRDENRNGKIDADELKWYLPTLFQYQQMYMGSAALATPLFDYASITLSNMKAGNSYHFATSNCLKIFAEQGASSNRPNWGTDNNHGDPLLNKWARNLRCVRNLHRNETGTDTSETGISKQPEQPYVHDAASRTITLTRYNKVCIRTSPISAGGYLSAHDNFDQTVNAPYKKFQYAQKTLSVPNSASNWVQMITSNDFCKEYYEEPDQSDKGSWRIPNQTEMMFIWMAAERPAGTHFITATKYRYNNNPRYCAVDPNVCYVCQLGGGRTYSVRPVRDILDE